MPASYHWEPPASTLAHRLAVIHPKIRMRWPQGSNAMPCVSPVVSVLRPRIAGTLARAPHPANGVQTEQLGLSSPISSPWVERDFARPHLPNNESAQTHRKFIRSENQKSQKRTSPAASNSFHNAKAHTIYSNMCCFKK